MIPKIIHCCWFGEGEKSELDKKCIQSWKKYLPDYRIVEWTEKNFDIDCNQYVKEAYEKKKYAFVADYARIYALYNYGGIYLDFDVEVKKNLNKFLNAKAIYSFESVNMIASAIIFSEKHNEILKEWLDSYKDRKFIMNNKEDLTANVYKITELLEKRGFIIDGTYQKKDDIVLYNREIFCPYGIGDNNKKDFKNSYTVHWCEGSWFDTKLLIRMKIIKIIKKLLGSENYYKLLGILKRGRK